MVNEIFFPICETTAFFVVHMLRDRAMNEGFTGFGVALI